MTLEIYVTLSPIREQFNIEIQTIFNFQCAFHFLGVIREVELLLNDWYFRCNLMRNNLLTRSEIPVPQHKCHKKKVLFTITFNCYDTISCILIQRKSPVKAITLVAFKVVI